VFVDETGLSQQPVVRTTWAPKGQTPILYENFNWRKLSAIVASKMAADRLVMFTAVDGFYDKNPDEFEGAKRIPIIQKLSELEKIQSMRIVSTRKFWEMLKTQPPDKP